MSLSRYIYSIEQLNSMEKCEWLTDREIAIFNLFYRRGWQIESIAAEMDVSRGTINNALRHIREKTEQSFYCGE